MVPFFISVFHVFGESSAYACMLATVAVRTTSPQTILTMLDMHTVECERFCDLKGRPFLRSRR